MDRGYNGLRYLLDFRNLTPFLPIFTTIQDPFDEDDDQNVAVIFSDDFVGSWNFSHRS